MSHAPKMDTITTDRSEDPPAPGVGSGALFGTWPSPVFVGDKLPRPFKDVLMNNGDRYCVGYLRRDGKFYADQDGLEFHCQYWMPLPDREPNAEMCREPKNGASK